MPVLYRTADALKLHDSGFWVVPSDGKKAVVKDWPNTRVERDELAAHFQRDPSLAIAIVLNQSPYIDVECDGPEAEAELQELFDGTIPPTPTWQSERGKHRLFQRPEGLPIKAKTYLGAIEFRIGNGKGALSVVPPSKGRKWLPGLSIFDIEPAPLPEHIAERLRQPEPPPEEAATGETILEGKRNDSLFQKAMALVGMSLPEQTVITALYDLNNRLCSPPLPESEVLAIVASAMKGGAPKTSLLDKLLVECDLWHDEQGEPFATIDLGEHRENVRVNKRNRQYRRWANARTYALTKAPLSDGELAEIAGVMEGRACFDGPEHRTWRRTAEHEGRIYIDLCDPNWQAIEIDEDGWRLVSDPPVKFIRAKAMSALPEPEPLREGESLASLLRPFLNVRDTQWPLVVGWLSAALRPRGPYPILKLLGEQGSGKTTGARIFRKLVDPNAAPVRCEPRSPRDLMISAGNAWVLGLDNLSSIKIDLSDALCRLATGGGFATRTLYSDDDETIFDATRPIILTSIEEIGTRSDLLERCLIVELLSIDESKRRAERDLWREFDAAHPRILGALFDILSASLRKLPEVEARPDQELARLADFEQWATAGEDAMGLAPGEFAEAYRANRADAQAIALESSPVVAALLKLVGEKGRVNETATALLDRLAVGQDTRQPGWPRTARVLSAVLRRVMPNLRAIGITATVSKIGNDKKWLIVGPAPPPKPQYASTQKPQKSATALPAIKPAPPASLNDALSRGKGVA